MESDLPIQPHSNLRRRRMGHKPPPAAMETQRNIPARSNTDEHQTIMSAQHIRSSSFSSFGRSLSRLLPANRKERGGTLKLYNDYDELNGNSEAQISDSSPLKKLKFEVKGDDGEDLRKIRSWSPAKIARMAGAKGRDTLNDSKTRIPNTFQALRDSPKTAKHDNRTHDMSRSPQRPKSKEKGWQRNERKPGDDQIPTLNFGKQLLSALPSPSKEIDATLKRAQQLYEEKKTRKDERRIFRESDDYLGVQGINPRTGYPDPSTATSSTGDVLDESTRQKVDEDERRMENARTEYKAALERREKAVRKLETERERRRKEKRDKGQKKKVELKARMRKDGRWKSEENRWSLVRKPDLSPIVQSLVGSPVRETPSTGSNILGPATSNPSSIHEPSSFTQKDYFGQPPSPATSTRYYNSLVELASCIPLPLSHEKNMTAASNTPRRKYMLPFVGYPSSAPQPSKSRTPSMGSPQDSLQRSQLPIRSAMFNARPQEIHPDDSRQDVLPIRHRKGGFYSQNLQRSSTETIVHKNHNITPKPAELPDEQMSPIPLSKAHVMTSKGVAQKIPSLPLATDEQPFLDEPQYHSNEKVLQESLATATLFPSASTSQVSRNFRLSPNPKDMSVGSPIAPQSKMLPVRFIDNLIAEMPSIQQLKTSLILPETLQTKSRTLAPLLVTKEDRTLSNIITPITTTTGFVPPIQTLSLIDGTEDIREGQMSPQLRPSQNARIPTPTFGQRNILSDSQRIEFPTNRADIDISSVRRPLATPFPTRQLVPRLCRGTLLVSGGEVLKSTPISTSTFPRPISPSQYQATAQKGIQMASSQPNLHRPDKVAKARCASLPSHNLRAELTRKTSNRKKKIFSRRSVDIGHLFKNRDNVEKNQQFLREMVKHAINMGDPSRNGGEEVLIGWLTKADKQVTVVHEEDPMAKKTENQFPPQKQIVKGNAVVVFCEGPKRRVSIVKVETLGKNDKTVPFSPRKTGIYPYNTLPFSSERRNTSPDKDLPKSSILLEIYRKLKEILATAWWFISPVFNQCSSLRVRWVRGELVWQDIVLLTAATVFGGGTFLVVVVCMKVLGWGLSIMRGMCGFGRWIVGF